MSFLVPKKWKSSTKAPDPLSEDDFIKIPVDSPTKEVKPLDNKGSMNKNKVSESVHQCPVCGTVMMSEDTLAVMSHVDECLSTAVAKGDPQNKPKRQLNQNNPPPTSVNNFGAPPPYYQPYPNYYQPYPNIQPYQNIQYQDKNIVKSHDSPFSVICPYTSCGLQMEAVDFYHHAILTHTSGQQGFSCPICTLSNGIVYLPKKGSNLYQHLQKQHAEFAFMVPSFQQPKVQESVSPPAVGSAYVVDIIHDCDGKECTICFEEFQTGDQIARLECFCVFHKGCVDEWFQKSRKCPLHKDY